MKNFFLFLKYLSKKIKIILIWGGFIYLVIYISNFLIPLFQKEVINRSIKSKSFDIIFFIYLIIIFAINYLAEIVSSIYDKNISKNIYKYLRLKFLEFFKYFKFQKIKEKGTGYFIQKYFMGTPHADMYSTLFSNLYVFIFDLIIAIAIYILLYKWVKIIAIFAFLNSTMDVLFVSLMTGVYAKENKKEMETVSLSAKDIGGYINTFTSTGIFSTFFYFKNTFKNNFLKSIKHYNNYKTAQIIYLAVLKNFKTIGFQIATIYFMILYFIKGYIDFGTFVAINLYLEYLKRPQETYFSIANSIASLTSFFSGFINYFNSLLLPFEEIFATEIFKNKKENLKIVFNGLTLEKENKILIDNLNFQLTKNDRIGIVGLSGEGKSLLLKLMLKELKAQKGSIEINEININKIAYGYYLSRINTMLQETEILNRNLIENIVLGKCLIKTEHKEKVYSEIEHEILEKINKIIKIINIYAKKISNYYKKIKRKNKFSDNVSIHILMNKKSLKYLNKIVLKIKLDENFYDTLSYFGIFLKEEHISFLSMKYRDYAYKYFKNVYKFFNTDKQKLLKLISNFHFNKLYVIEEEVEKIIKELELEKLKGRDFGEEGHFISGGEKQKIALARFILKKDYDFFIIDEPFSSLDAINEEKLLKLLSKYTEQKPGIIISHKLNVLNAISNKIIVIDKGKIVQKGTHQELLNKDGIYKELIAKFKNNKDF